MSVFILMEKKKWTVCFIDSFQNCILQDHHEEDFFLYIAYSDESVYGA